MMRHGKSIDSLRFVLSGAKRYFIIYTDSGDAGMLRVAI